MKKYLLSAIGTALISVALAAPLQAAEDAVSVSVEVLSEVEITDTSGAKVLERQPLDVATPQQTVIYKITVENSEPDTVSNVVLNIPVADSLLVQPTTLISDIEMVATFSAGADYQPFDELQVADGDKLRKATPSDIQAIKIEIPELPRDEGFFVEYDAVVK